MRDKPFLIVSDIHLGAVPRSTEAEFRRFLEHAAEGAAGLLVNGDLFDFWFEYRTVIHGQHFRVLAGLASVVDAGVPVWFVGGNHDAWGGSFLREEVGIQIIDGPVTLDLGGRRALVVHGDGVGAGDRGYRMLRRVIRNPLTVWAFRQLHPDWGSRIARLVSTTEHKTGQEPGPAQGRAGLVRQWAAEQLRQDRTLDLVIAGHVHHPEVAEVEPGRFYVNSGDWINHFSYVSLPPGGGAPELKRWPSV